MTSRRRRLLFAVVLLTALDGVLLMASSLASRRTEPVWSEVAADDPRVAGVFHTLSDRGLTAAIDSLDRQSERDSLVLRAGHQLAHALGRQAFALSGGSDTVILHCSPAFGSGCYHGVVEASLAGQHTVDMVALERMCSKSNDSPLPSASVFECVHGVGHGVLGAVAGDVAAALHDCDALSAPSLQGSCHEGVFMEAFSTALGDAQRAAGHAHATGRIGRDSHFTIDSSDPYGPCREYQSPYGEACWLFQGFVILRRVHFDGDRALRLCDQAPEAWAVSCYKGVGHQLTGLFQRDDRWVIERCQSGRPTLQAGCAAGAVLARIAEDWTGGRARSFCGHVPSAWREECVSTYERRMKALRSGRG